KRARPTAKRAAKTSAKKRRARRAPSGVMQALGRHARDVTGLSFVAAGWFMGGVLLLGWDGGSIGALARDTLLLGFGQVSYLLPPVGFAVGVLIVARSRLADPGPFRVGL